MNVEIPREWMFSRIDMPFPSGAGTDENTIVPSLKRKIDTSTDAYAPRDQANHSVAFAYALPMISVAVKTSSRLWDPTSMRLESANIT